MTWISRKIHLIRRSWELGATFKDRIRLLVYQFRWLTYSHGGIHSPDRLRSFRLRQGGGEIECWVRDIGSDWVIFREMFYHGDYDEVAALGFTPKHIYDLGANAGLAAVRLAVMFPDVTLTGWEPGRSELRCAGVNYGHNGLGSVLPYAVGRKEKRVNMWQNSRMSGGQSLMGGGKGDGEWVEVMVCSVDVVRREMGLAVPDLIKIDVEGSEWEALLGMPETLALARGVVMETHGAQLHADCLELLLAAGYRVVTDVDRGNGGRVLVMVKNDGGTSDG